MDMNFYSVRDLRTESKAIWEKLSNDGEVVITNNGKPAALMLDIAGGDFEEVLKSVRQARAMMAFTSLRKKVAMANAYMTEDEIETEIAAYRKEKSDASSD
jgi:PHD/YefM family antitoxin component YafN of YafNO toxin-antitoxin module